MNSDVVQQHQYCMWSLRLESDESYSLDIERYNSPNLKDQMQITITKSDGSLIVLSNAELFSLRQTVEIEDSTKVEIRAKTNEQTQGSPFKVKFNSPRPFSTLLLFGIIIVSAIVIAGLCICMYRCIQRKKQTQRNRQSNYAIEKQTGHDSVMSRRHGGALEEVEWLDDRSKHVQKLLQQLPEQFYSRENSYFELDKCVICYCDFLDGDMIRKLTYCGHIFHSVCIQEYWSSPNNDINCPVCTILADGELKLIQNEEYQGWKSQQYDLPQLTQQERNAHQISYGLNLYRK